MKATNITMDLKIAIQGIRGSNHHQVALEYFSDQIDLVECMSFHNLVDCVVDGYCGQRNNGHRKFDSRVDNSELCIDL